MPPFRDVLGIHRYGALLTVAAVVATTVMGRAEPAVAGNVHAIQTAPSPSNGEPVRGGGSWIVNKPSGYYLGRSMVGWEFDNQRTTGGNWHYGRAITGIKMCGWAMPGSMGAMIRSAGDSCSDATSSYLMHRRNIGRDFNARAHEAGDGTPVPTNTACTLRYNYFFGTDFAGGGNGGHWAQPAGNPTSPVRYRFTTLDGRAVAVRDTALGWGFLPVECVQRPDPSHLHNDDD